MEREFKIEVAKHTIQINIGEDYKAVFIKNYGLFLSRAKPEISIDVELSNDVPFFTGPEVGLRFKDNLITVVDSYSIGSLDWPAKSGKIKINPINFLYSLGTFLRNIYILLVVLEDRGIALHAVAVLKDEEVYLFIGPSGAGKTTVAKLSSDRVILSDDLVMLKKLDGEFKIFPAPNWGDKQTGPRENRAYRINSMFKLIKDSQVYLERFRPSYALADIFTIPHIPPEFIPKDELLMSFLELITSVPYFGLHFLPEPSFWDCIEESLRSKDGE